MRRGNLTRHCAWEVHARPSCVREISVQAGCPPPETLANLVQRDIKRSIRRETPDPACRSALKSWVPRKTLVFDVTAVTFEAAMFQLVSGFALAWATRRSV